MTKNELIKLLEPLPSDCVIMSNSGWECGETDIGGIWYNKNKNECHLTQGGIYQKEKGYKNDYGVREYFEMLYCTESIE